MVSSLKYLLSYTQLSTLTVPDWASSKPVLVIKKKPGMGKFILTAIMVFNSMFLLCYSSENRYVLFLTENYAALDILKNPKNYLDEGLSISQSEDGVHDVQPFILFGSSFPKDKEYTQV